VISYAQNAEDVILARVFQGQATGRYVDIGAGHPSEDSVTKHFYDRGWRGINVEPMPSLAEELSRARPEDVNLVVGVGAKPGEAMLHVVDSQWGRSTLDTGLARTYRDDNGWQFRDVKIKVITLAELLDRHPGEVEFLKIDVEGAEQDVIEGADWNRHRPRVIVVEATEPGAPVPSHEAWEPILLDAGYRCGLFDGLNRFYALADDTEAQARMAAPANVFDEFERHDTARLRAELETLQTSRPAEVGYIRRLEETVREAQQAHADRGEQVQKLEDELAGIRRDTVRSQRHTAALEWRVAELEAQLKQAQRKA
jgi:FkbM family methyltransferase